MAENDTPESIGSYAKKHGMDIKFYPHRSNTGPSNLDDTIKRCGYLVYDKEKDIFIFKPDTSGLELSEVIMGILKRFFIVMCFPFKLTINLMLFSVFCLSWGFAIVMSLPYWVLTGTNCYNIWHQRIYKNTIFIKMLKFCGCLN